MKRLPVLGGACLAALLSSLSAAPIAADSRLSAVTVYADRAVVTRSASIELSAAGLVEVTFGQLPASLIDESLQVTGRGAAEAMLLDVAARQTHVDFAPNARVQELEEAIRGLTRQDHELADRTTVLGQQRDYVLRIQQATTTPAKDGPAASTQPETWVKLLTFTEEQLNKFSGEIRTVGIQREELQARRTALEEQLNELRGADRRSYKTVTVRLDAKTTGRLELTLRYALHGASWSPSYDVRVSSAKHEVQLGYFGLVRQNTGEDWRNVELTLSTARPSMGGQPPELSPWIVEQVQPMVAMPQVASFDARLQKARKGVAQDASARSDLELGVAGAPAFEAKYIQAQLDPQATSASFRIAVAADVPTDNSPQKVPIATAKLETASEYVTTPKLLPAAFLNAKVTNSSEFPLLAGAMNVFLDDTFVAASSLRTVMPGEKFDLALGVDEGIAVKRKLNNRFTEDTGLVTKSRRITYDVTITVQNNKPTAEKIVVQDQVPVSRHEKIVVTVVAPPEKEVKPDSEGVLKWTLSLKPGEKRELPLKVSVEHPVDLAVSGLE